MAGKKKPKTVLSGRIMFKEHLKSGFLSLYFPLGVEEQFLSEKQIPNPNLFLILKFKIKQAVFHFLKCECH